MQNQNKKIVSMLSDASVYINSAHLMEKVKRDLLLNKENSLSEGDRILFKSRENLISEAYIRASTNIIRVIYQIDRKDYSKYLNLFELWNSLSEEEKNKINEQTYSKYKELYELRSKDRIVQNSNEDLNKRNTEIKLKKNIDLLDNENNDEKTLDADFFKKFTLGITRYFISDYLFGGKLADIQRQKESSEVINSLRSIIDEEDAKFRKLLANSRLSDSSLIL